MIGIAGAGAFGTALAVALAKERARGPALGPRPGSGAPMRRARRNAALPGVTLPENVSHSCRNREICGGKALLLAVPMQAWAAVLDAWPQIDGRQPLVACCKGVDLATLRARSRCRGPQTGGAGGDPDRPQALLPTSRAGCRRP
jgi:glycerol-3-phosphate dehydrogenase (NAD(P)+)